VRPPTPAGPPVPETAKAIVRAIEARDPAAAERRMREHITGMEKLVFTTQGFTNVSVDDTAKPSSASRAEISS
jgi:DNA-binding FadR family transcriptional regulator